MSKIDEMLKRFDLENQIIVVTLNEYFEMFSGMSAVTLKWQDTGNCKFIDYMNVYMHRRVDVKALHNATVKSQNQTILQKGDVLFTAASEVPDECAIAGEIEDNIGERVFLDDHLFGLRLKKEASDKICKGYLKYAFNAFGFRSQVKKAVRGVTRFYVAKEDFMKLYLSLPPRPVQDEIVKALDAMDATVKALEEERAARQEQFEAVRERIWDRCETLVPLSEIATEFYRGAGILRTQVTETGIPCVRYGEIYTQYQTSFTECKSHTRLEFVSSPKWVKTGSLIFAITGEKVEEIAPCVAYLGEEQCLAGGDTAVMEHNQNPSYLAYALMTTEAQRQKSRGKVKGKVVHSSIPDLKKVKIPLPEKSVQDKIASGLDAMRAVVAALDEEIAARREQFAGWLEKLMTFKMKEVA